MEPELTMVEPVVLETEIKPEEGETKLGGLKEDWRKSGGVGGLDA